MLFCSYSYDLTNTLQANLISLKRAPLLSKLSKSGPKSAWTHNEKFLWNHSLLKFAFEKDEKSNWVIPLIHGFVDQASMCICHDGLFLARA
jgi:hypothetical protein